MEYIDDLGYSNIVDIIQGEEIKAADILNTCAYELNEVRIKIMESEACLRSLKFRETVLLKGSHNILKHIKRQTPLIIQRHGYVVLVTENDLIIERNVI